MDPVLITGAAALPTQPETAEPEPAAEPEATEEPAPEAEATEDAAMEEKPMRISGPA